MFIFLSEMLFQLFPVNGFLIYKTPHEIRDTIKRIVEGYLIFMIYLLGMESLAS